MFTEGENAMLKKAMLGAVLGLAMVPMVAMANTNSSESQVTITVDSLGGGVLQASLDKHHNYAPMTMETKWNQPVLMKKSHDQPVLLTRKAWCGYTGHVQLLRGAKIVAYKFRVRDKNCQLKIISGQLAVKSHAVDINISRLQKMKFTKEPLQR